MARDLLRALRHTTIFGQSATQHWVDVVLWEHFFNKHPDIKAMIEFGTGMGGLSIAFALHAVQRDFAFFTFDARKWDACFSSPLARLVDLEGHFQQANLFKDDGRKAVLKLLRQSALHPLLLFCDNGDKPREFADYVPHLRPGDYVAVHDWGKEFGPEDAALYPIEPLYFDLAEQMEGITRMWRVKP